MVYVRTIFLVFLSALLSFANLMSMESENAQPQSLISQGLQQTRALIFSSLQKAVQRAMKQPDSTVSTSIGITKLSTPCYNSSEEIREMLKSMNESLATFNINLKSASSSKEIKRCTMVIPNRYFMGMMEEHIAKFPALTKKTEIIIMPLPKGEKEKLGSFMMSIEFDDKKNQQARL